MGNAKKTDNQMISELDEMYRRVAGAERQQDMLENSSKQIKANRGSLNGEGAISEPQSHNHSYMPYLAIVAASIAFWGIVILVGTFIRWESIHSAEKEKPNKIKPVLVPSPAPAPNLSFSPTTIPVAPTVHVENKAESPVKEAASSVGNISQPLPEIGKTIPAPAKPETLPESKESSPGAAKTSEIKDKKQIYYTIQVRVYSDKEQAKKLAQAFKNRRGIDTSIMKVIVNDKTFYRVLAGRFEDKEEALKLFREQNIEATFIGSLVREMTRSSVPSKP